MGNGNGEFINEEKVSEFFTDLQSRMNDYDGYKKEKEIHLVNETGADLEQSSNFSSEVIIKYFSELQFRMDIYNKAERDMDVYLARRFNVFNYIKPKENDLSDILADFLNPQGRHGQKEVFLQAFINMLDIECCYDLVHCRVTREKSTSYIENHQRRMDITLNFDNKFAIVIENKPWADEQVGQLQDYQEHLTKKFGNHFCLVYLTGDGSPPESLDTELKKAMQADRRLVVQTYARHTLSWLETCYKECKAEKIRNFLQDFMEYIGNNFKDLYEDMEDGEDGE